MHNKLIFEDKNCFQDCAISEKTLFESLSALGIGRKDFKNQFEESGNDLIREMISEVYLKKFKVNKRDSVRASA